MIIDLSQTLSNTMPAFSLKGPDGVSRPFRAEIRPFLTHEQSRPNYDGLAEFEITEFSCQTSIGTYLDSPRHRFAGGKDIAALPLDSLAEVLAEVTPPQFRHVFFSGSGSEGNDTVVRMVRRYWDLLGQPERQVIISRKNGYHGSTMAGASLGGMSYMHAQGGLPIPNITHIDQPYWYENGRHLSREEFGKVAAGWLEAKILEIGEDQALGHGARQFIPQRAGRVVCHWSYLSTPDRIRRPRAPSVD